MMVAEIWVWIEILPIPVNGPLIVVGYKLTIRSYKKFSVVDLTRRDYVCVYDGIMSCSGNFSPEKSFRSLSLHYRYWTPSTDPMRDQMYIIYIRRRRRRRTTNPQQVQVNRDQPPRRGDGLGSSGRNGQSYELCRRRALCFSAAAKVNIGTKPVD